MTSPLGQHWRAGLRAGFGPDGRVACEGCFAKKLEIDRLREENQRLKQKLRYEENRKRQHLNAHTPSSKIAFKKKSSAQKRGKFGGGKPGHRGHGRKLFGSSQIDRHIDLPAPQQCRHCQRKLQFHDTRSRQVLEIQPLLVEKLLYRYTRAKCPQCHKLYRSPLPVLPRCLYGNALLAWVAQMHYLHGLTLGRICEILGPEVPLPGLLEALHRLAKLAQPALAVFRDTYRHAQVKHADETGWRIDGENGWAWIFCSSDTSLFDYQPSRSSQVARNTLGENPLPGVLVVDRFPAYNQTPCKIQYCYAHLLREVQQLEKDFSSCQEVQKFVHTFGPCLAKAMRLGKKNLTRKAYRRAGGKIVKKMKNILHQNYAHPGIPRIQHIFHSKAHRLYHWAACPKVPADNNRAEREIRRSVIARKISFGSQSQQGAKTRSVLSSLLSTAKKRLTHQSVSQWLHQSLDQLALNPKINFTDLLPPPLPP